MSKDIERLRTPDLFQLLHRASQAAEAALAQAIDLDDLTPRQMTVMRAIADGDAPSQTDICEASGIDRSTLADIVQRLVRRGWIARRRTRSDARRYALRLTEKGTRALEQAAPRIEAADVRLFEQLSPPQRQHLKTALVRLIEVAQGDRTG